MSQKGLEEKKETHWFIRMFKPRLWVILGGGIFLLLLIQIGLKETFSALKSETISSFGKRWTHCDRSAIHPLHKMGHHVP